MDLTRIFHPLRLALTLLLLGATAPAGSAQPAPAWFRGGAAEGGVVETHGVDSLGGLAWRFRTGGPVRSSPTVTGGVVHFGSTDGALYALDAATGAELWRHEVGASVGGAPLVAGGLVVVADRANRIHAVDRRTGVAVWRVETGPDLPLPWGWEGWDYLLPSPVLAGSTVLVGSGDGHLYALDLHDGSERWRFRTGGRVRGSAAIHEGVAYFGSGDGVVYGVDVDDGTEVWRFETAGVDLDAADWGFDRTQIQATPAVDGGTLYVGSRDASLYALPLTDGEGGGRIEPRWTFEDGSAWVVASAAVDGGTAYSARSSSANVRALDTATGEERWVREAGGPVFASPVVVGETVYVASLGGRLWALDAGDGSVRWWWPLGAGSVSTPAVWNGRLYVGSDDGHLYALERAKGAVPRLAVYRDDGLAERSTLGRREGDARIADHFVEAGYERLDGAALRQFLEERVDDGAPSAVVFAMDALPPSVASADDREPGAEPLLLRYLRRGGKVVWLGLPPLMVVRDPVSGAASLDRERPSRLLGVDHGAWNADVYPVAPTAAGRRWGLETPWLGGPVLAADEPVTALATDELGRIVAWAKGYGGPPGTGFVQLRASTDSRHLEEIRRVAELGVFHPPPAPPGPASGRRPPG